MAIFEYGGPPVDILDGKTAANNGDGTYGEAHDLPSIQLLSVKIEVVNIELPGDGEITSTYTRQRKGTLRLRNGSIPRAAYTDMFGVQGYEYGTTPTRRYVRRFGPRNYPYFAIAGKTAAGDNGTGCNILFAPKCKVTDAPDIQFQSDTFVVPEMTITALPDPNYLDENLQGTIFELLEYETAVSVTIPPVSYA